MGQTHGEDKAIMATDASYKDDQNLCPDEGSGLVQRSLARVVLAKTRRYEDLFDSGQLFRW